MGRRVVLIRSQSRRVEASITEVLRAEIAQDGELMDLLLWCEIDDDLPPIVHNYYLIRDGESVPEQSRPSQIPIETMGGVTYIDGPEERAQATFVVAMDYGGRPLFLYDMPQ